MESPRRGDAPETGIPAAPGASGAPEPLQVWIPRGGGEAFLSALRPLLLPGIRVSSGDLRPDPPDYDVLVAGRPTAEDLDASPRLRTLVIPFAGLPPATRDLLLARPRLAAHNLHHNAPATAEMAVGLLIAAARRILPADRALRAGDWRPRYAGDQGLRLAGRTALVVGLGAVGGRVAAVLRALEMEVHAIRRRPGATGVPPPSGVGVHGPDSLDTLLPRADVLVLAVPATPATHLLLDARRLALLPPGAVLVNVARGDVVDEGALYAALAAGRLGGAGLDVWWRYPAAESERCATPPSAFPFGDLESVVLSPHRAGHGLGTEAERARGVADLLNRQARGQALPHRVDPGMGY